MGNVVFHDSFARCRQPRWRRRAPVAPSPPHSTTTTRLDVRRDFVVLRDARDVRDQGAWTRAKSDRRGGGARTRARRTRRRRRRRRARGGGTRTRAMARGVTRARTRDDERRSRDGRRKLRSTTRARGVGGSREGWRAGGGQGEIVIFGKP